MFSINLSTSQSFDRNWCRISIVPLSPPPQNSISSPSQRVIVHTPEVMVAVATT